MILKVSKGTYIRSYAMDLASHLNTVAMLKSLRRLQSGPFLVEHAKVLDDITLNDLIPLEVLLESYPKIQVSDFIAEKIKHGMILDQRQYHIQEPFRVYDQSNHMIAFYEPKGHDQFKIVFYNEEP
jgi:tRNA pseudouridine55 synthase